MVRRRFGGGAGRFFLDVLGEESVLWYFGSYDVMCYDGLWVLYNWLETGRSLGMTYTS